MLNHVLAIVAFSQVKTTGPIYTQSLTTASGIVQMQTLAQQLVREGKPDIWLVGAVHIGSKQYYTSLQTLLDSQEVVLFEGVKTAARKDAPASKVDEKVKPKEDPANKPIYKALSDALGLEFQLNMINYNHPNWKNVDMTWEELDKMNKDPKGNDKPGTFSQVKQLLDPKSPQAKMFTSMLDTATPGMKEAIKLMIVKSVASGEVVLDSDTENIIVKARNKVVVASLAASISSAKPPKSIAVFYGAKHFADMETTLVMNYGYKLGKQQWFTAADADPSKVDATGKMLLDALEKQKKSGGFSGGGKLVAQLPQPNRPEMYPWVSGF